MNWIRLKKWISGLLAAMIFCFSLPVSAAGTSLTERSDFIWGVNGHNRMYEAYPEKYAEKQVKLAAELGVKLYRFNFNPKTSDDLEYLHYMVSLCEAYGMDMMLVMDDAGLFPDNPQYSKSKENDYIEALTGRATMIASLFKDRIKYIQVFNELDIHCLVAGSGGNGDHIDQYNKDWLQIFAKRTKAVVDAIKAEAPQIKTCVNISYVHTGWFDYLASYEGGVEFDVIGLDWYSDMGILRVILNKLATYSQKEIIVCETNIVNGENGNDGAYLEQVMNEAYNHSSGKVKGMFFYELLDELNYQDRERYYGLVNCERNGEIGTVKPAYTRVQKLLGGESLPLLNVKPTPLFSDDDPDVSSESLHNSSSKPVSSSSKVSSQNIGSVTSKATSEVMNSESIVSENQVSSEPASSEEISSTSSDTPTEIKEKENGFPIWIFIIIAAILVLGGAGFALWWFIIRKKQ